MDENKGGNLSDPRGVISLPLERLVHCNILEHLILHIKIAVLRQKDVFEKSQDVIRFFTTGGVFMLCEEIFIRFIIECGLFS